MASTLNASTTLGLISSADTSGVLQLQTNGTATVTVDTSGNVGIGTATAGTKLDVVGAVRSYVSGGTPIFYLSNGTTQHSIQNNSGSLAFYNDGTRGMDLTATGLGIGTSSPSTKLVASGTTTALDSNGQILATVTDAVAADKGGQIMMGGYYTGTTPTAFGGIAAKKENGTSGSFSGYLQFLTSTGGTGNTEKARIDSSGNLLVGTTTGLYSARITASTSASCASLITTTSAEYSLVALNQGTSGNNGFVIFQTENSPVTRGSITYNRGAGLVAYNVTSDYRAKDISGPVTDSGALIDSVPVYMGTMKGATQERPMFIAHETPSYAHIGEKDAVDENGNPVYQQMDASALIPVMWAEIQSLRQRLAVLEGK